MQVKNFKEVETLMPQSKWARKASLMYAYSDILENALTKVQFLL